MHEVASRSPAAQSQKYTGRSGERLQRALCPPHPNPSLRPRAVCPCTLWACTLASMKSFHSGSIDRPQSIFQEEASALPVAPRRPDGHVAGSCGLTKMPHVTSCSQLPRRVLIRCISAIKSKSAQNTKNVFIAGNLLTPSCFCENITSVMNFF